MTAFRLTGEGHTLPTKHDYTADSSRAYSLRMTVMLLILGFLMFVLAGFTHNFIPSESMEPNLRPGDHIVTVRDWLAYPGGAMPSRGDIIVFRLVKNPEDTTLNRAVNPDNGVVDAATRDNIAAKIKNGNAPEILIKRVIGLPGDVIQIKDNDVYVNGKLLHENYDLVPVDGSVGYAFPYAVYEPLTVPPGRLFVLGDNRNNSDDGRFWGTLDRKDVIGRFVRVLYHESKYDPGESALLVQRGR